ncbi:MAG: hypothetical protein J5617_04035 [Bacilli bacterium]|nr:hypothetical protein [Bacilli bacterium]
MGESILNSIKTMLGPDDTYPVFDVDLITLINAELAHLNDLGAGPSDPFVITGDSETWDDFSDDKYVQSMSKTLIYYTIKIGWDQPSAGFVLESMKELRKETEWRLERYCSEN